MSFATCRQCSARGCQLHVDVVVWLQLRDCHLVRAAPDVCLLAQQAEAGHCRLHRLDIDAPQVDEENHLRTAAAKCE